VGTPETRTYPLIFTFRDDVDGEGFLARVTIRGRALMVDEGDGWWLYGVEPGGMAESGGTPHEAYQRFRRAFTAVLFETAVDAKSFDDFESEIRRFARETDQEEEARWLEVSAAIRSGEIVPEAPFDSLPRKSADLPVEVQVERLDEPQRAFTPKDNILDEYALTAA